MIRLDKRAGSYELLPHFPQGTAELAHLEYGDASFTGLGEGGVPVLVGVERKSLRDFLSSVESGRLQGHQLPGLLACYNYVYLILEGFWRHGKTGYVEVHVGGGWKTLYMGTRAYPSSYIHKLLNTFMVKLGVLVYRTDNEPHTASLIHDLEKWWQKPWDKHKGHKGMKVDPHPVSLIGKPTLVQKVAAQLPLLGWTRAERVAEKFPTVEALVVATPSDWEEIPGIGPGIAEQVWKSLHGEVK